MAYVERPTFTQPVPPHATVRMIDGEPHACWVDRLGKSVRALVLPNGRCRRTVPGRWIGRYRDANGKSAKTPPFGDRSAALDAAIRAEKHSRAVKEGRALPASSGRSGKVTLAEHLPDYLAALRLQRVSSAHVAEVKRIVGGVIARHRLTTPAAVDGVKLDKLLEEDRLAGDPRNGNEPFALKTRNHWVTALKAFGNWLLESDRVEANPFRKLATVNHEKELKRVRRALPVDSLRKLIATTAASTVSVFHLPPGDRAALYVLAAYSGLRRGALFALTPESFTWDGKLPVSVYSPAKSQKAGQAHGIPLSQDAARLLAPWLKERPAGVPLFRNPPGSKPHASKILKHDLTAAGIPYKDAAGQVFDFHSLRVQFGVMLALSGVSLVVAQQLLQHSTPVLTANIYSKVGGELAGEVAKLPSLGASLGANGGSSRQTRRSPVAKRTPAKTSEPRESKGKRGVQK